jgi:hypothetical protein
MEINHVADRIITEFDPPPAAPISDDLLFPDKSSGKMLPDWK